MVHKTPQQRRQGICEVIVASTSFAGKVNAPEFPQGLEWVNTDRPLTMQELRGKIVILDFWTYC